MRGAPSGPVRMLLVWVLLELVAAAQIPAERGSRLGSWMRTVAAPVVGAARFVASGATSLVWGVADLRAVVADHKRLRMELERCRAKEVALSAELEMLRSALPLAAASRTGASSTVIVACRYRDLSRGLLEIAGGLADGLRTDQPVLAADGVVGRVWRVGSSSSWVELVTGPSAAVAVQTPDGSVHGLAEGDGTGRLMVRYVPRTAQLLVGSRLVTSGADGLYPRGVPVARVASARERGGAFLDVVAVPAVDAGNLTTVLVLSGWTRGRAP